MRSMSKLGLLVCVSAPLSLFSVSAFAADPPAPAAPPPATVVVTTPAAPVPPAPPPPPAGSTMVVAPPNTPVFVGPSPNAAAQPASPPNTTGHVYPGNAPTDVTVKSHDATPAIAPIEGLVSVHIQTKELVTLEHRTGPGAPWVAGCQTPCDTRLPGADEFRIIGEGVNDSAPFSLTTPKGDTVKIHVAPGLKDKAKVGEYMTFAGAVMVVGALVVGIGAADPGQTFNAGGTTNNYNWNVIAVGTTIGVAGLVTGILGGAWWYDNSHTRVAGDVQGDQPARGGVEPRYLTGFRTNAPNAAAYTAPLFQGSF